MNRAKVLRDAAHYAERYAQSQDAIRAPSVAEYARRVRTELLNMADELDAAAEEPSQFPGDGKPGIPY